MEIKFLGASPADQPQDFGSGVFEVEKMAGSATDSAAGKGGPKSAGAAAVQTNGNGAGSGPGLMTVSDAPICSDCGSSMIPNGACYRCGNCGGTSGCS